jgi:6-phosphogluconolactonase
MSRTTWVGVLGSYTGSALRTVAVDGTTLTPLARTEQQRPSFVAVHPFEPIVVAVSERAAGQVVSYRVDQPTGALDRLGKTATGDAGPCHVTVGPRGEYVVVSHYTGGSVAVLPIEPDGSLAAPSDRRVHTGSGPRADRQASAHPHSATFVTDDLVYVPDLGADRVAVYELSRADGTLRPVPDGTLACRSGSGPRHLAVHPSDDVGYLLCELDATLSVLDLSDPCRPTVVETHATVPDGVDAADTIAADVRVHPSGSYVYASNRGHDSIATFACSRASSRIERVAVTPSGGRYPRALGVHPHGDRLFACHTRSDDVVSHRFDRHRGSLSRSTTTLSAPSPSCLRFVSVAGGSYRPILER